MIACECCKTEYCNPKIEDARRVLGLTDDLGTAAYYDGWRIFGGWWLCPKCIKDVTKQTEWSRRQFEYELELYTRLGNLSDRIGILIGKFAAWIVSKLPPPTI